MEETNNGENKSGYAVLISFYAKWSTILKIWGNACIFFLLMFCSKPRIFVLFCRNEIDLSGNSDNIQATFAPDTAVDFQRYVFVIENSVA